MINMLLDVKAMGYHLILIKKEDKVGYISDACFVYYMRLAAERPGFV